MAGGTFEVHASMVYGGDLYTLVCVAFVTFNGTERAFPFNTTLTFSLSLDMETIGHVPLGCRAVCHDEGLLFEEQVLRQPCVRSSGIEFR